MSEKSSSELLKLIGEKALLNKQVCEKTTAAFSLLKSTLRTLQEDITDYISRFDKNLSAIYTERSEFETEFNVAGDSIICLMNTNIFTFDKSERIWKSSYIKEDENRAYCGMIYIYNFLSDSFKYHREADIGHLVARIFINSENHFFVDGKKRLGFLFNQFDRATMDAATMKTILEECLSYSILEDPHTPPLEQMNYVSVRAILESTQQSKIAAGKRLGFRFQSNNETTG